MRCLAAEWAQHGITVNTVAPTFVWTDGTRPALADKDFYDRTLGHIPMGGSAKRMMSWVPSATEEPLPLVVVLPRRATRMDDKDENPETVKVVREQLNRPAYRDALRSRSERIMNAIDLSANESHIRKDAF